MPFSYLVLLKKQMLFNFRVLMIKPFKQNWIMSFQIQYFPSVSVLFLGEYAIFNVILLFRIADVIPETNDDLDDYRLAASMYVNMKLLETNKDLNWKVDSLGKCLKRALSELCLLRLALQNTVSDLQTEIDLLRKNTLSTIRRIIQDDIKVNTI
jgi:hypothetical protein